LSREFGVGSRMLCLDFIGFGVIENQDIGNNEGVITPFNLMEVFK
jgi:hypothetical protein